RPELHPRASYDGIDQMWTVVKLGGDDMRFVRAEGGQYFQVTFVYKGCVNFDSFKKLIARGLKPDETRTSPPAALTISATPLLVIQTIVQMAARVQWLDNAGQHTVLTGANHRPACLERRCHFHPPGRLYSVVISAMDQQRQDVASAGRQLNDRLSWLRTFVVGLMVTLHYGQKSGRKAKKVVDVRPAGATFLDAEGKEISVAVSGPSYFHSIPTGF
ncbi:hypothetical protein BKA62DRAFT_695304, partial [Auriculariales sp. MPI-PUGE-AT-0066]